MANYRIDNKYIFNESAKEIRKLYTNKKLKLTCMRSQCLAYILLHANDEVITKNEMSQAIWGDRSQFTSEASLTQALYLIRRDLKTIGIDDLFITVPKKGVAFNKMLIIEDLGSGSMKMSVVKEKRVLLFVCACILMIAALVAFNFS